MFREAGVLVLVLFSKESNLNSSERKGLTSSLWLLGARMRAVLVVRNHWVFESRMNILCSNIITSCTVYPPCFILMPGVMDTRKLFSIAVVPQEKLWVCSRQNLTWQVAAPSPPVWLCWHLSKHEIFVTWNTADFLIDQWSMTGQRKWSRRIYSELRTDQCS